MNPGERSRASSRFFSTIDNCTATSNFHGPSRAPLQPGHLADAGRVVVGLHGPTAVGPLRQVGARRGRDSQLRPRGRSSRPPLRRAGLDDVLYVSAVKGPWPHCGMSSATPPLAAVPISAAESRGPIAAACCRSSCSRRRRLHGPDGSAHCSGDQRLVYTSENVRVSMWPDGRGPIAASPAR
jgi:hypothetical protein